MAPKSNDEQISLVNYGKGCAVFGTDKDLNIVFKSLGGKGNRNLTHPESSETTFGWVFGLARKPILKEFLKHQDVEKFFEDHPEIKRWTPPTPADRQPKQVRTDGPTPARQTGPAQKNVMKTIERIFNNNKSFPGPVVAYLVRKVLDGAPPNRGATVVSIVKLGDGSVYKIYEGSEVNIDSAIELNEFQAKKAKTSINVFRIDANLVAICSQEPVVEADNLEVEEPTEEDEDETEPAEASDDEKTKKKKSKKSKKSKKVASDEE